MTKRPCKPTLGGKGKLGTAVSAPAFTPTAGRISLSLLLKILTEVSGCVTDYDKLPWTEGNIEASQKRMSPAEVVKAAQQLATERGFSLADYQAPRVSFTQTDQNWGVWFWENPPVHVGGYLFFIVDDKTGLAELLPSR